MQSDEHKNQPAELQIGRIRYGRSRLATANMCLSSEPSTKNVEFLFLKVMESGATSIV
jgi:hypothetical protein